MTYRQSMDLVEQDQYHRQLALDADQSFIVQAPAGSGKTELLIQRLLTLLTRVNTPEEILAITFTKKAANEMRLRVIKALKHALNDPEPDTDHAKQTWLLAKKALQQDAKQKWNLINNPNQLRIQTIDSLCSNLTKQLPLLSHFGSQPDIADNPNILYREAVQEVIMHVEENYDWSNAITKLLLHLDNDLNKLHDLLVNLLAKRDQWLPYIQISSTDIEIKKQLEKQLGLVISDTLSAVQSIFPKNTISELLAIARFAASNIDAHTHPESDILTCQSLTQMPGITPDEKNNWLGLAKLLLTKSYTWRKRVDEDMGFPPLKSLKNPHEIALHNEYRQRLTTLITTLSEHENLRLALIELFYLPNSTYNDTQWEILQALLQVLKIVAAQLRVTFQQYGQIDFIENTQAALAALGNDEHPTDLALALDYHIKHILIDEFQDTSYTQFQLLEKLTKGWETHDGRTLFVVGDPMQSIYRFREAEVGLFIRMRSKGLHHIHLIPLTLAVNFRSTSAIVEWNNMHFQNIFPQFNDMATGAVTYSPSVSNQNEAITTQEKVVTISGYVDAHPELEAHGIIEIIHETRKKYSAEKIAILVRSRSHLAAIIPALKKAKLAYRAIDIDPLASRQHIQDVLSLTCALLHPADRIAWLSVLRAPWCGLSLSDLFIIAGNDAHAAIITQLERADLREKLSEDGRSRIGKILPVLKAKIAVRERYHLRTWIENTWLLIGGPACLNDYADYDDINAFFKLLENFSNHTPILNLDKLKEKMYQLFASTQHDDATIQIMTIHTSKGLEFDTVILPQLERKNPNDDKSLLLWMDRPLTNEQMALLLAPIHAIGMDKDPIYEYINRQQRIKADYEMDRLFYVAATRAKKRLHLFFNISTNSKNEHKPESGSFLEKIWSQLERNKNEFLIFSNQDSIESIQQETSRPIQRITPSWINPILELQSHHTIAHMKKGGFQLVNNTFRLIGTATHKILQMLANHGTDWWTNKSLQDKQTYVDHRLRQLGMNVDNHDLSANAVLKSVENTLTDHRGQWILKPHRDAKSEFAMTAVINGKHESLVIDRIFIDDNNVLWIIDYKTAELTHPDVNSFLENEHKKYAEQMQKYFQALSMMHDGTIRLGLYFPAVPAWREWGDV